MERRFRDKADLPQSTDRGDISPTQGSSSHPERHFTGSTSIDYSNAPSGIQALIGAEEKYWKMHSDPDSIENRLLQGMSDYWNEKSKHPSEERSISTPNTDHYDPAEDESLHFSSTPEVREPYHYPSKDTYPKTKKEAIAQGKAKIERIRNTNNRETREMYKQRYKTIITKVGEGEYEHFSLQAYVRGYAVACHEYEYYTQTNVLVADARFKYRPNRPEDREFHDEYGAEGAYDGDVQPFVINEHKTKMFITGTKPLYASEVLHNLMLDLKYVVDPPKVIKSTDIIEKKTIHILNIMDIKMNNNGSASFDKNSDEYNAIMAAPGVSSSAYWIQQDYPHKEITKLIVTSDTLSMIDKIEYIIGDRMQDSAMQADSELTLR